jgi:hypothetical protein
MAPRLACDKGLKQLKLVPAAYDCAWVCSRASEATKVIEEFIEE